MGANHNFYNTVWTGDDWGATGPWCGSDEEDTGVAIDETTLVLFAPCRHPRR